VLNGAEWCPRIQGVTGATGATGDQKVDTGAAVLMDTNWNDGATGATSDQGIQGIQESKEKLVILGYIADGATRNPRCNAELLVNWRQRR